MSRRNRDQVREISSNGSRSRNSTKRHRGTDHRASDGHAEEKHQIRGMEGRTASVEFAKVSGKGKHAVAGDGKSDTLGRHEAGGGGAGGVDPENDENGDGSGFADELDEVFGPIVGVGGGDDGVEILHAEEDHDEGLGIPLGLMKIGRLWVEDDDLLVQKAPKHRG